MPDEDYLMDLSHCTNSSKHFTNIGNWLLVIGSYTKVANAAASVYTFPLMELNSTTSFILIVRSFIFRPNHDLGSIFYFRTNVRLTRRL